MATEQEKQQEILKQQLEINQAASELIGIIKEQKEVQMEMLAAQQASRAEEEYIRDITKGGVNLAKELQKFDRRGLDSKAKRNKFEQNLSDLKKEQELLAEKILEMEQSTDEVVRDRARNLNDIYLTNEQVLQQARVLTKEYQKLDRVQGFFEGFESLVKDIPIVRSVFSEFTKGSKVATENFKKFGDVGKARMAGVKAAAGGLVTLLVAGLVGALIKGLTEIDKGVVDLRKNLQVTASQAGRITSAFQSIRSGGGITFQELTNSAIGLSNALGTAAIGSVSTLRTVFTLTDKLGMSADQASSLLRFASASGKSFQDATADVVGLTESLNNANNTNLRYGDILNDISEASSATLLSTQKFPGGIARAAFEARKLGLSLSAVKSAGGSLLNFQESISAELEAELLTGKQLNLQKAREAALMDDQATLANEIAKNIGTAADFGKLNVLQQEAVAKAVGMERDEVAKTLMQREALLALEKESKIQGLSRMNTEEQIAALMKERNMTREQALRAIGQDELAGMERTQTAQEALGKALGEVGTQLANLIKKLTGSNNPLGELTKVIVKATDYLQQILLDGLDEEEREKRNRLIDKGMTDDEATGLLMAARGNSVGSFFRAGFGGPTGTAEYVSRRMMRQKAEEKINKTLDLDDFTIRSNPKDTLVMAGGTRFGEETNALLKELITEVRNSNNIYIDSRKVNSVLAMNAINQ